MSEFLITNSCLCDSNKPFNQCCEPLLTGSKVAKTAKQLMRSRYTAYALGGHGEYLIATWLPESTNGLSAASLSEKEQDWLKLEILNSQQKGNIGRVEFNAYYKDENAGLNVLHEKSTFQRIGGRWYYVKGEVETIER